MVVEIEGHRKDNLFLNGYLQVIESWPIGVIFEEFR